MEKQCINCIYETGMISGDIGGSRIDCVGCDDDFSMFKAKPEGCCDRYRGRLWKTFDGSIEADYSYCPICGSFIGTFSKNEQAVVTASGEQICSRCNRKTTDYKLNVITSYGTGPYEIYCSRCQDIIAPASPEFIVRMQKDGF